MNQKSISFTGLWYVLLLTALCLPANAKVIYVDDDATGANNGSNWQNAYKYLQDALTDAKNAPKPVEIHVAQGIYKPDRGTGIIAGNRDATFQLISDVNIVGGYAGLNQPDPNIRDFELYSTILSGDLNGNDVNVNNVNDLFDEPTRAENSYHVVKGSNTNNIAKLDGFIITAGNANGTTNDCQRGAGIYVDSGRPILKNCIFTVNSAYYGGGMHNSYGNSMLNNCLFIKNCGNNRGGGMDNSHSNPILNNCTFSGNSGHEGGGIYNYESNVKLNNCTLSGNISGYSGGGIYNSYSNPILNNCTFSSHSGRLGGGMYNSSSSPFITNCTFSGNSVNGDGGGMYNSTNCCPIITNCKFSGNSANEDGGGMYNYSSSPTMTNCTFAGNLANRYSSVIYNAGTSSKPTLINCILWNNSSAQIYGSGVSVTYCDIQGGWTGEGNIDVDPLFADPDKGDYHLKSQAGRWDPNSQSWFIDDIHSPCIDAGDPNSPIRYEPNSLRINMGAYGGTLEASMSLASDVNYFQKSYAPNPADGAVDISNTILNWISDANAIAHEVYLGTSEQPPFVKKCYQTNFNPGILEPNTQYYWRIDDVDSLLNRVIGNIWTFTTRDYSVKACNPSPADGDGGVSINVTLSWDACLGAIAHNVYFGTSFNDVNKATIATPLGVLVCQETISNSYKPSTLKEDTKYYWRVDKVDSNGITTTGDVWVFRISIGKGKFCFIGSTPVWVGDKTVAISTASVGQSTGGNDTIEQVQEHEGTFTVYDVLLDSGNCITVAENHYFMTEAGDWYSLHDLKAGMRLKTSKGSVGITSITKQPKPYTGKVYNLKIQGSDQYMVGEDAVIARDY
jgi:hypothetical protein